MIKLNEEQNDDPITLLYFEQIPWYFRVFLHTLKITTLDDLQTEIKPGKEFRLNEYIILFSFFQIIFHIYPVKIVNDHIN